VTEKVRSKIALFCDVATEEVIECSDAESIYEVPLKLADQHLDELVLRKLHLPEGELDDSAWTAFLEKSAACEGDVDVAIVGKYVSLPDAYLSVIEAISHAGIFHGRRVHTTLIDGEELTGANVDETLSRFDGILVPGGFGERAFEGKILAANYARTHDIPFLGICLGLQVAVCEFARNVCGLEGATSGEFSQTAQYRVIDLMPEQEDIDDKGGTMRLGAYPCKVTPGTKAAAAYGEPVIYERHRHRYEVNNAYRETLQENGMTIAGLSPNDRLVEMVELSDLRWYVASQGHPEFKSRPTRPHPLFRDFVGAACSLRDERDA